MNSCRSRVDWSAWDWLWLKSSIVALLLACCLVFACGKKAPPRPPESRDAPAVETLGKHIDGDRLTLTWSLFEQATMRREGYTGLTVYKSMRKIIADECSNCPILFERVAVVSFEGSQRVLPGDRVVAFTDRLEKGYRYHYKVSVNLPGGNSGKDSKPIVFQY